MFFDNKRFLMFIITVSVILTVTFAFSSCKNYLESGEYRHKVLAENIYADEHKLSYSDAELMKSIQSEINETNRKIEALNSVDSQTRASIKVLMEDLCGTLSYKAKSFKGSKVKASLTEYFTEDCLKNIDDQFVFSDHPAYRIKRQLKDIVFSKSDSAIKCLAIVEYTDRNDSGKEYLDCSFSYNKSIDSYYISDISVVKG